MTKKRWLIPVLVLLVIISAASAAFFLSRPEGDMIYASVNIQPQEQESTEPLAPESTFAITLDYSVSQEQLRAMLSIEPDIGEYTIEGSGKKWTLRPAVPLEENTVYTVRVINPDTGAAVQSFAFQTRSDLLVNTVYPGDGETFVPLETGIEMTFNAQDVDLQNYFEIKPAVAGSFETNGYTVIFKPTEPLTANSIYRVTLKAGLTAPGGMALKEDYTFSFETVQAEDAQRDYEKLRLDGPYAETFLPGDPLTVKLQSGGEVSGLPFEVKIHRYGDISGYMKELRAYDAFYRERYGEKTEYVANTTGLEEVASYTGELFSKDDGWGELYAILPDDLGEGWYVVTISGEDASGADQFVQKLIQVCNLSVYTQSADGDTLFWLNDPATGEPVAKATLQLEDVNGEGEFPAVTMADGTARVMTGESEAAYLTVLRDGKSVYFARAPLSQAVETPPLSERYYTALYTDREAYQPSDTIHFWGVVKPRSGDGMLPQSVWVSLSTSWPRAEVYRVKAAVNEADGTFEGAIAVTGIAKDYYELSVNDGEQGVYTSKGLSLEKYIKPPYEISVALDKDHYYFDEAVGVSITARYFDGTPVSNETLTLTGAYITEQSVTLDASGRANCTVRLKAPNDENDPMGWSPRSLWIEARNASAQDVYVSGSANATVLPSRVALKLEGDSLGKLTVRTAQLDDTKLNDGHSVSPLKIYDSEYDRLAGAPVDVPVTVLIHSVTRRQVETGSYYDYVNKRTVTEYETQLDEAVAETIETKTSGGVVAIEGLDYKNTDDTTYWAEARVDGGAAGTVSETNRFGTRPYGFRGDTPVYTFVNPDDEAANAPVDVGDAITLGLYRNGAKTENTGRVLYSVLQRRPLKNGIFEGDSQTLTMEESFLPNVVIAGAYFDGRHIYAVEEYAVDYDYTDKGLNVTAETDKETYRPGETATVTVKLTDAAGNPVSGSVCVGVADEAVFDVAEQHAELLDQLYRAVYYPRLRRSLSYAEYDTGADEKANPNTAGGAAPMMADAETGGSAGGVLLREDFADTALFKTAKADENGQATVTFELPDNVTSWRSTALAVTNDLKAGDTAELAAATLPFYLSPLYTDTYLEGDDIVIAAGAVGTGVHTGDAVSYTVTIADAAGRELDKQTAEGTIGVRVPFTFGKLEAGAYTLTIEGVCGENSDAVRYPFSVVKQALTTPVYENMPLKDAADIESVRYPVKLMVYDRRMQPYMEGLQYLSMQTGERTEIIAAAYRAQLAYNELLDEADREPVRRDSRLDDIQNDDGGVRLLPVSESDAAVTAKMLVAAPELINKGAARDYLKGVLQDPAATQDDRVMAYLGLAAAKEPILLDLLRIISEEGASMTDAQRLYLGTGLALLGDFTSADLVYNSLGGRLVKDGDMLYAEGADGTLDARIQTSAAALMLASVTSNPDADALMRYMNNLDQDRAKSYSTIANLEMLCYINSFIPSQKGAESFSYTDTQGETQKRTLENGGVEPLSMSYEALAAADFQANDHVYACALYTGYADAAQIPDDERVQITKTYTPVAGDGIGVSDRVRVDLTVRFSDDAPDGCYIVSDYIPSGMRYMEASGVSEINPYFDWMWGRIDNEGQAVFGRIYRNIAVWRETQAARAGQQSGERAAPLTDSAAAEEKMIPSTSGTVVQEDTNVYTLTYYVSAALPGEFVSESAYVTPYIEGAAAKSERGTVTIEAES